MSKGTKLLGIFLAFACLQARARTLCEAEASIDFPIQRGSPAMLDGEPVALLGVGGTASVYRRRSGDHTELVKVFHMDIVRDTDLRRLEIWQEIARIIKLDFLRVMSASSQGTDRLIYPDLEGRDLESLLAWPGLPPAYRKTLLQRYQLLKQRLKDLSEGKYSRLNDRSTFVSDVAWSHNEEGGHTGPGYLILYYDDFKKRVDFEAQIQIKPANIIVDKDLNFIILDPN